MPFVLNPISNNPGKFIYSISTNNVATIDNNGTVTIIGPGPETCTITVNQAETDDCFSGTETIPLTVSPSTKEFPVNIETINQLLYFIKTRSENGSISKALLAKYYNTNRFVAY